MVLDHDEVRHVCHDGMKRRCKCHREFKQKDKGNSGRWRAGFVELASLSPHPQKKRGKTGRSQRCQFLHHAFTGPLEHGRAT